MNEKLNVWYKNGLKFECTGCGKCCTGSPGAVWLNPNEIQTIADFLKISKENFLAKFTRLIDGRLSLIEKEHYDCVFLNGKFCSIYPVRPVQCQTFPFWHTILESKENWEAAKSSCEGINDNAPIVSFEEIEKQRQKS